MESSIMKTLYIMEGTHQEQMLQEHKNIFTCSKVPQTSCEQLKLNINNKTSDFKDNFGGGFLHPNYDF
jgi:hypothetical protein